VLHFSELEASGDESQFSAIAMLADTSPLPEEVAEQLDLQQAIQRAIHTLPPKVHSTIMLRYAGQLSYTEIAGRLGISAATVKTYFHRAKPLLRAAPFSQKR
jgi:RNA polymerase sigma factor (sigma-70 family)